MAFYSIQSVLKATNQRSTNLSRFINYDQIAITNCTPEGFTPIPPRDRFATETAATVSYWVNLEETSFRLDPAGLS